MNEQFEKLKSGMLEHLLELDQWSNPLERLNQANDIVGKTTVEIKKILADYKFENDDEEINFFKNINAQILSHSIEEGLKYNISVNRPINTSENLVKYYEDELKALQSFLRLNNFHYQYFKNEFKELDQMYFLRGAVPITIPIPECPGNVRDYCPPMSYLFAKFIAYERVQYFILQQITKAKHSDITDSAPNNIDDTTDLKWTGDVINVVELAYGLWLTGQLNHGNASLNQIVRWLEKNLDVNIGIIQRRFSEIERRKRLSPTKYIDQMKNSVLKKIESSNA